MVRNPLSIGGIALIVRFSSMKEVFVSTATMTCSVIYT